MGGCCGLAVAGLEGWEGEKDLDDGGHVAAEIREGGLKAGKAGPNAPVAEVFHAG